MKNRKKCPGQREQQAYGRALRLGRGWSFSGTLGSGWQGPDDSFVSHGKILDLTANITESNQSVLSRGATI